METLHRLLPDGGKLKLACHIPPRRQAVSCPMIKRRHRRRHVRHRRCPTTTGQGIFQPFLARATGPVQERASRLFLLISLFMTNTAGVRRSTCQPCHSRVFSASGILCSLQYVRSTVELNPVAWLGLNQMFRGEWCLGLPLFVPDPRQKQKGTS